MIPKFILIWSKNSLVSYQTNRANLIQSKEVKCLPKFNKIPDGFNVFLAINAEGEAVGAITLAESFAIYAGGHFGIICELYVAPAYRSQGVGKKLLNAVKEIAKEKGWKRIDVTAPPEEKWVPTVKFYEREGFTFTGPKMRFDVS